MKLTRFDKHRALTLPPPALNKEQPFRPLNKSRHGEGLALAVEEFVDAMRALLSSLWSALSVWLLTPVSCFVTYYCLVSAGFPYPGLGILLVAATITMLLHAGLRPTPSQSLEGAFGYLAIVTLGNIGEILSDWSHLIRALLDINFLPPGEPITIWHWLGLFWLSLSSALMTVQPCRAVCPGECRWAYRRRVVAVGKNIGDLLQCAITVAVSLAFVVLKTVPATAAVVVSGLLKARRVRAAVTSPKHLIVEPAAPPLEVITAEVVSEVKQLNPLPSEAFPLPRAPVIEADLVENTPISRKPTNNNSSTSRII